MDENQYATSTFDMKPQMVHGGETYTMLCKRTYRKIAQSVCDGLIEQGKKSVITEQDGEFIVWWA
jgi:hypothetical protein